MNRIVEKVIQPLAFLVGSCKKFFESGRQIPRADHSVTPQVQSETVTARPRLIEDVWFETPEDFKRCLITCLARTHIRDQVIVSEGPRRGSIHTFFVSHEGVPRVKFVFPAGVYERCFSIQGHFGDGVDGKRVQYSKTEHSVKILSVFIKGILTGVGSRQVTTFRPQEQRALPM